ncbi:hypothetical protein FGG78_12750 [Thioclava sp. BHET1]|nr:hypothetical protein FGG78_12750 [Thioclava sp. BHET1]
MTRLPLALALMLASTLPAAAFDAADRNAVTQEVAGFEKAVQEKEYDVFFDTVPPKMMKSIAQTNGITVDKLEDTMQTQIKKAMSKVTMKSFHMDVSAMTTGKTSTGRAYAQIPTTSEMEVPNMGTVRATNTTLALKDNGEWYLVRIDSPAQQEILRKVYPDFKDVSFPKGTMETLN